MSMMTSFVSPSIPIYYATETGNAEDVAYFLHLTLSSKGIRNSIHSTSKFDIEAFLENKVVLFIVSTSGDGDAPVSMQNMWSFFLRKSLPNNLLSGIRVGVFGLGDSSYEKFNATARKLFVRLKQLGATPLLDIGLGDDQSTYGYFTAFDAWKLKLLEALPSNEFVPSSSADIPSVIDIYKVSPFIPDNSSAILQQDVFPSSSFEARVMRNDRLTRADWMQEIRLLSFQFPSSINNDSSRIQYRAGDVAAVYYENASLWVNRLLRLYDHWFPSAQHLPDTSLRIERNAHYSFRENHLPTMHQCTLHQLFTKYLDICSIPKRSAFLVLAAYANGEEERAKLIELSNAEGTDLYYDYCIKERRNFVEIFEEFRTLRLPLHKLLEVIPVISPRSYSIASSPLVQSDQLDLCVGIVNYRTKYGRTRPGLCTSYLSTLSVGASCRMQLREGLLQSTLAATKHGKAMLLIGPGTGISVMRSIVQHYAQSTWRTKITTGSTASPPIVLYVGCRKKTADFLFEDEWCALQESMQSTTETETETAQSSLSLFTVVPAFSQDQMIKEYVTHKIKSTSTIVWSMIQQDCCIVISGSAKRMPKDVKEALIQAIMTGGDLSRTEAEKTIQDMIRSKRYVVDAW